jgi:tetratricopeptide (TPR) repeat protein
MNKIDEAINLNDQARQYHKEGQYTKAEQLFMQSLTMMVKVTGSDHPNVAAILNNLALLYKEDGRYDMAEGVYQRSLTIYENTLGPHHLDVANTLYNFAKLYDASVHDKNLKPRLSLIF